jgi:site-specific recombinase XerD
MKSFMAIKDRCRTMLVVMLFSKAKTNFLEYLEIDQNRSQKTIANYDHYLTRLIDYAGDITVDEITPELIRKWRLWLNRLGTNTSDELGKNTLNYHLIALRSFLKFCAKQNIITASPEKIELARVKRKQVTFLSPEELKRLFDQPDPNTLQGLRDRAILELLFSSGLRVSELVGLDKDHINLKRREFTVRGKGQKDRPIFISDQAAHWLQKYLDKREDNVKPLFLRYSGKKQVDLSGNYHRLTVRSTALSCSLCASGWHYEACQPAHLAALIRYRLTYERRRSSLGTSHAWPQQHCNNPNLYAYYRPSSQKRPRAFPRQTYRIVL